MPQFAYTASYNGWETDFPSGRIQTFKEQEYIELDSFTVTAEEVKRIRSPKEHQLICPICEHRLVYNRGYYKKDNDAKHPAIRRPSFYHLNNEACFESESLAHAMTKRFLFEKLLEAGYEVREEHKHRINGKKIRADVAAFTGTHHTQRLRLVVEVQASNIYLATMAKRVNAYFEEGVPTAWVLLLDDFFEGYTAAKKEEYDPDLREFVMVPLNPGGENLFTVNGKDSKAFLLLMDLYGYVLGVNYTGNIFLIRRDPDNESFRTRALLTKSSWTSADSSWTSADEVYRIARIADKDIVPTLLLTPLIQVPVEESTGSITFTGIPLGALGEGSHPTFNPETTELTEIGIDFESGKLVGQEAEKAINPIALIHQTWEAQRLAEEKFKSQENHLQELQELIDQAEEHEHQVREFFRGDYGDFLINEELRHQIEETLLLNGYQAKDPTQLTYLTRNEGRDLLSFIQGKSKMLHRVELLHNDETIWDAYEKLSESGRLQLERNVFPDALPLWFAGRKRKLAEKELLEKKKQRQKASKEAREKKSTIQEKGSDAELGWNF
ncbi:competence protein CoiA family protein [Paenibacillus sp. S02]|uniref:competence protein CoiA family protein n=1 Tax=Paenibacillus sp. S02 TaxID=2823904 RepID=UPI001C647DB8|nr:competence protein CoiA family protein [Paenibacillus sp. S02]QYK67484.1 Competence protein CoiA-like family protein [Paenibacillus sp. S02]